jgi:hypothetical protein
MRKSSAHLEDYNKENVMQIFSTKEQKIIAKIRQLSLSQIIELEDFIDFLIQRRDDRQSLLAAAKLSESVFAQTWDNEDDTAYDDL